MAQLRSIVMKLEMIN